MVQIWKAIAGFEGSYEVSSKGQVRSLPRLVMRHGNKPFRQEKGCILKHVYVGGKSNKNRKTAKKIRYSAVNLYKDAKVVQRTVASLVLETFVGPRPSKEHQACHFPDLNTKNNKLSNLRWASPEENAEDREIHGNTFHGETHPGHVLTAEQVGYCRLVYKPGDPLWGYKALGRKFGVRDSTIKRAVLGTTWAHLK